MTPKEAPVSKQNPRDIDVTREPQLQEIVSTPTREDYTVRRDRVIENDLLRGRLYPSVRRLFH